MIATILPSSATFHAVAYNETKVANGSASLLEIKNFGDIDILGYSSPEELTDYLIDFSSRNTRIKKPQLHVAFSCKGHEYTPEQLKEIAHRWLNDMGYGDPNQPILIYEHHDTDNTHIHVITSRVDPRGKKIDHAHERRRSQQVLDKIMNTDLKAEAEKNVKAALSFDFRSETQFKAVMEAMNYECFMKGDRLVIKKGGVVQTSIAKTAIESKISSNNNGPQPSYPEVARLRAILQKYRDLNSNRVGLEKDLKALFGISLVFFGKADSPYGYALVDFRNKKVYNGSQILSIKTLLDFRTPEEHIAEIEDVIEQTFLLDPTITTKQLNAKLKRFGAFAKKGIIHFGNNKQQMAGVHIAILKRNDKIAWLSGFNLQSMEERDIICRLMKYEYPDHIEFRDSPDKYYTKDYQDLHAIFSKGDTKSKIEAFESAGFKMICTDNGAFAVRVRTQTIVDLKRSGFLTVQFEDIENHYRHRNTSSGVAKQAAVNSNKTNSAGRNAINSKGRDEGSHYANREWEVGKKDHDRDDPDYNGGMSY